MKYHISIVVLLLIVALGGCSAIATNKTDSDTGKNYWGHEYSGTVCAIDKTKLSLFPLFWPLLPFNIADTVLSFALETLLLPFELFAKNPEHGYNRDCDYVHF